MDSASIGGSVVGIKVARVAGWDIGGFCRLFHERRFTPVP